MATKESGYESHKDILKDIITTFNVKSALEFGLGYGSTKTFLDNIKGQLISIEMDSPYWYEKVAFKFFEYDNFHPLLVPGAERACDFVLYLDRKFDMVLVDGCGLSRWMQCNVATGKSNIIVCHDTETKQYDWGKVIVPPGWIWLDIVEKDPWTAVLTNNQTVYDHIKRNYKNLEYQLNFCDKTFLR